MYKTALPFAAALALTGCPEQTPATPAVPTAPAVKPMAASQPAMPAAVAPSSQAAPAAAAASGAAMKVADVFAQKDSLANKPVTLRGKVVKFNANIMGSNWLHVQDGSGGPGTNDITVTTKATAAVGDMVEVTGAISRGKDFGAGYKFDVIIENAQVTKQ